MPRDAPSLASIKLANFLLLAFSRNSSIIVTGFLRRALLMDCIDRRSGQTGRKNWGYAVV